MLRQFLFNLTLVCESLRSNINEGQDTLVAVYVVTIKQAFSYPLILIWKERERGEFKGMVDTSTKHHID